MYSRKAPSANAHAAPGDEKDFESFDPAPPGGPSLRGDAEARLASFALEDYQMVDEYFPKAEPSSKKPTPASVPRPQPTAAQIAAERARHALADTKHEDKGEAKCQIHYDSLPHLIKFVEKKLKENNLDGFFSSIGEAADLHELLTQLKKEEEKFENMTAKTLNVIERVLNKRPSNKFQLVYAEIQAYLTLLHHLSKIPYFTLVSHNEDYYSSFEQERITLEMGRNILRYNLKFPTEKRELLVIATHLTTMNLWIAGCMDERKKVHPNLLPTLAKFALIRKDDFENVYLSFYEKNMIIDDLAQAFEKLELAGIDDLSVYEALLKITDIHLFDWKTRKEEIAQTIRQETEKYISAKKDSISAVPIASAPELVHVAESANHSSAVLISSSAPSAPGLNDVAESASQSSAILLSSSASSSSTCMSQSIAALVSQSAPALFSSPAPSAPSLSAQEEAELAAAVMALPVAASKKTVVL